MFYSIYLYVFTRPFQPTSRCSQHFQHTTHPTLQCFTPVPTHLTMLILFLVPFRGFMLCPTHVTVFTTFKHFPHLPKPTLHCSGTSHPTPRCSKPQYSPTRTTIRRSHSSYPLTVSTAFLIHLVFFKSFQSHITIFTSLPTHFTVFNNRTQFRFITLSNLSYSVYQTQITFVFTINLPNPLNTNVYILQTHLSVHTLLDPPNRVLQSNPIFRCYCPFQPISHCSQPSQLIAWCSHISNLTINVMFLSFSFCSHPYQPILLCTQMFNSTSSSKADPRCIYVLHPFQPISQCSHTCIPIHLSVQTYSNTSQCPHPFQHTSMFPPFPTNLSIHT